MKENRFILTLYVPGHKASPTISEMVAALEKASLPVWSYEYDANLKQWRIRVVPKRNPDVKHENREDVVAGITAIAVLGVEGHVHFSEPEVL